MNQQNNNGSAFRGAVWIALILLCVFGTGAGAGWFSGLLIVFLVGAFYKWLWF